MLRRHRIGQCHDLGAVDMVEVEDVLAAHHPASDHAVSDGLTHVRRTVPPQPDRAPPLPRSAPLASHDPICARRVPESETSGAQIEHAGIEHPLLSRFGAHCENVQLSRLDRSRRRQPRPREPGVERALSIELVPGDHVRSDRAVVSRRRATPRHGRHARAAHRRSGAGHRPKSLASHRSAARLWGIARPDTDPVDIILSVLAVDSSVSTTS